MVSVDGTNPVKFEIGSEPMETKADRRGQGGSMTAFSNALHRTWLQDACSVESAGEPQDQGATLMIANDDRVLNSQECTLVPTAASRARMRNRWTSRPGLRLATLHSGRGVWHADCEVSHSVARFERTNHVGDLALAGWTCRNSATRNSRCSRQTSSSNYRLRSDHR